MRGIFKYLTLLFLFFTTHPSSAQTSNNFLVESASYLPPGSDSLKFDFVHYDYHVSFDSIGFQIHFDVTVAARKTDCKEQESDMNDYCNYQRVILSLGIIEAQRLNIALSENHYDEKYKKEIFQIADSVFRFYNHLRSVCQTETQSGSNQKELIKWEQSCIALLEATADPNKPLSKPLSLNWQSTGYAIFRYPEKSKDPRKLFYYAHRSIAFADNFKDNHNGWTREDAVADSSPSNTDSFSVIENGGFKIHNPTTERVCYIIHPTIDYNRDFEINLDFEMLSSQKKSDYIPAFFWGLDSAEDKGSTWIGVSRLGDFSVTFCHGGNHQQDEHHHFTKFTAPGIIHLTIRKVNNQYYFFVNGAFRRSYDFETLTGNAIALCAEPESGIVYRELKIKYLN